jgi:anti-sigma factor RsiW
MNCADWEERIALYAGSDLAPAKAAEVERHLAECAGCQMFAGWLKASLELLRDAHGEALDGAHFAAVRSRVVAQLARERRPLWRRAWVYGLAAVAAALLVAVAVRPSRWAAPRPPEVAMVRPPAAAVVPVAAARRLTRVRPKPRPKAGPGELVLVRLVTDNPDVVIYWISERRGE